jgi:hypothetical protein
MILGFAWQVVLWRECFDPIDGPGDGASAGVVMRPDMLQVASRFENAGRTVAVNPGPHRMVVMPLHRARGASIVLADIDAERAQGVMELIRKASGRRP